MSEPTTAYTKTGGFPIGFRRGWSERQKDLAKLLPWAKAEGFAAIDLARNGDEVGQQVLDAGLAIGSVDLLKWNELVSEDVDERDAAIEANIGYIQRCAAMGVRNFFCVVLPKDPSLGLTRNHELAAEGFGALTSTLEASNARIVIEGWPGPGSLACTPDGYDAFFANCSSPAFGINYDPSHLVRMGIDPLRFLRQFKDRIYHVHGKDTAIDAEAIYRYGRELGAADGKKHHFGGTFWRYTIPGQGVVDWPKLCEILAEIGYDGAICIELEDERFTGTDEGTEVGLIAARDFLKTV